ncbi:MAG: tRNA (adenosine(37)-N6)-threonylcarbamoyltransferase complex transferase subunit TsaD [Synergistaceae bacterium]|nr:tRNA (adenosine(37)-N6)-threonylcarbamoyltransferase complex transferase subunit TsaD [Synergistaceae bacterium]
MLILGIETSCDDTGVAILRDNEVLCELLSSQIKFHADYGGVIPEMAARKHLENLLPLVNIALSESKISGRELDLIAVTRGPGLMGALMVGVQTARALSQVWGVPLIGINHLEGHIFAGCEGLKPPFLSLIVSGGHTEIITVRDFGDYELLGQTRDDAAGEAFDKGAKILGLKYPGGPEIEKLARSGNSKAFNFPVPLKNSGLVEFSFSGLKTALLWQVKKFASSEELQANMNDLCASYQAAIIEALIAKIRLAVKLTGIHQVSISGGVSANGALREALRREKGFTISLPELKRCTDNAVMTALAGQNRYLREGITNSEVIADPSLHEI